MLLWNILFSCLCIPCGCASLKIKKFSLELHFRYWVFSLDMVRTSRYRSYDNFYPINTRFTKPLFVKWTYLQFKLTHKIKFCEWLHSEKLRCHDLFSQNKVSLKRPGLILLVSSKLQSCWLKQIVQTQ